jgi:hypothetical protein
VQREGFELRPRRCCHPWYQRLTGRSQAQQRHGV